MEKAILLHDVTKFTNFKNFFISYLVIIPI